MIHRFAPMQLNGQCFEQTIKGSVGVTFSFVEECDEF